MSSWGGQLHGHIGNHPGGSSAKSPAMAVAVTSDYSTHETSGLPDISVLGGSSNGGHNPGDRSRLLSGLGYPIYEWLN